MKAKFLVLSSFCLFGAAASLSAQTGAASGTPFGHGQDSIRCMENLSLFVPHVKSGNFQDALIPWQEAYSECPASNRNIYIQGVKIVGWQIQNEKDNAKKLELINTLVKVYQDWITYFGDKSDFPAEKIKEKLGMDYATTAAGNANFELIYGWLNESTEELGTKSNPAALLYLMQAADVQMKQNKITKEQYIADYLRISGMMDEYVATAANEQMKAYGKQMQPMISVIFTNSGAADCATLETVFTPKIEEKSQDLEYLKNTLTLFRKVGCNESAAYFKASEYAHLIEPTTESAAGMAKQSLMKKDHDAAITYYQQAAELSADSVEQAEFHYNIALLLTGKGNYSKARQEALLSAKLDPSKGKPYILIASMYAGSAGSLDDAFMKQAVFYAAVDKLETAKRVDPSVTDEANKLIGSYKAHFPKNQEIFFQNLSVGQTITIPGWIGEQTRIR